MATILIIDDDVVVRQMLEALLSEEHECHTADRAEQAVELIQIVDYDLVITDVSMPGLTGLDVLRRVQQQRHTTPVIVISGRADEYKEAALQMGAFAFLAKPFALTTLETTLQEAIAVAKADSN
ncbi:MAG: response regulator [Acidobacteriota bacterium]